MMLWLHGMDSVVQLEPKIEDSEFTYEPHTSGWLPHAPSPSESRPESDTLLHFVLEGHFIFHWRQTETQDKSQSLMRP